MLTLPTWCGRRAGEASVYRPLLDGSFEGDDCPMITNEDCKALQMKYKTIARATDVKLDPSVPRTRPEVIVRTKLRRIHPDEKFGMMLTRVESAIIVILVRPDSMAARAGVRFGDEILAVDGVSVGNDGARDVAARIVGKSECALTIRQQPHVYEHALLYTPGMPKRRAGLKLKNGAVCSVERDSVADFAGIQTEVVVIAVNNVSTIGLDDKAIKKHIENGPPVTVVHTISRETFDVYVRGIKNVKVLRPT